MGFRPAGLAGSGIDTSGFSDAQIPVWDAGQGRFVPQAAAQTDYYRVVSTATLQVTGQGAAARTALTATPGGSTPYSALNFTMPAYPLEISLFIHNVANATVDKATFASIEKADGSVTYVNGSVLSSTAAFGGPLFIKSIIDNTDFAAGAAVALRCMGWVSAGGGTGTLGGASIKHYFAARRV